MSQTETPPAAPGVWFATLPEPVEPRPELRDDLVCDVAIIGGGFTGLWTAYYLKKADPGLDIVVLEREVAGSGASGRNGGWCHPYLPAPLERLAELSDRDGAIATQRAMYETVDEIGRVCAEERIDCSYHKGGTMFAATGPEQLARVREEPGYFDSWGFGDEVRWLEADEVDSRVKIEGCLGASFTAQSAVVQPAALVRGLADVVENLGVRIFEGTPVRGFGPGDVQCARGWVRARYVIRATEGYSTGFSRFRRSFIPIYSLMIATAPLPAAFWDEVGWSDRATFTDGRHLYVYVARTPDDRIAIGGRGAPYHFGSRVSRGFEDVPQVFEKLRRVLQGFFPVLGDVYVTHRWGGPLAIPRDWTPSIGVDAATGLAWAGGYVGDGVATSNLSGRVLRDLLLGRGSDLTRLPIVNHRNPCWEPEPLRWLGVSTSMAVLGRADGREARSGRPSPVAAVVKRLLGV